MAKRTAVLGILITFLCGCTSTLTVTKEVKIPVYQKIDIEERETPKLPVNYLTSKSSPKEVAIAYNKSIIILLNEINIYQSIIKKLKEDSKWMIELLRLLIKTMVNF